MSIEKGRAYFRALGIEDRVREFEVSSATVELAAQALGVGEDTAVSPELWAKFLNLEALHTRVLVNQADGEPEQKTARALAKGLSCPVCMAALQKGWIKCLC